MAYVITLLVGIVAGAACMGVILMESHRRVRAQHKQLTMKAEQVRQQLEGAGARDRELNERAVAIEQKRQAAQAELDHLAGQIQARREASKEAIRRDREELECRLVSYKELQQENSILKRDLQNIDVTLHKLGLDVELQAKKQEELDERARELGNRYLKENVKWIGSSLSANNFSACKQRLQEVIVRCRGIGLEVSAADENKLIADLKMDFEKIVRAALEREEQARIKAQIREEAKVAKEIERELKQVERERIAIQAALDRAMAEATDKHSEEIERLKARLAEAEEKERAVSQAQMTKAGYVYVISNLGSFGEGVFKVGMTRRLEPKDRVRELGDASVPFPFDVHMMISCVDAPALENALHKALHKVRINKTNPRKEFFKTDLGTIVKIARENSCKVEYVADVEALEYRQSVTMSEEDSEYIEGVYDAAEDDSETVADEA
ncbi:MAG TPA: GIY-YIG nuclease family protein [Tepidisphaeraceae bacterium]|jgi:hypothetical protein|nr:GIY-YIG nuclease family protein [Tepidisphaeraceae bacterium]